MVLSEMEKIALSFETLRIMEKSEYFDSDSENFYSRFCCHDTRTI